MIPKQTTLSRDKYAPRNAAAAPAAAMSSQPHKLVHSYQTPFTVPVPMSARRQTTEHTAKSTRNYGRKLPDPGKLANITLQTNNNNV